MGKTPASDKRMPDGADGPVGWKRSKVMDKESPNSCEAFDGKSEVFPLDNKNYLKDAAGQN